MEKDNTCRAIEKKKFHPWGASDGIYSYWLECSHCGERLETGHHARRSDLFPKNFCQNCGKRIVGSVLLEDGSERNLAVSDRGCETSTNASYCSFCGQPIARNSSDDNSPHT